MKILKKVKDFIFYFFKYRDITKFNIFRKVNSFLETCDLIKYIMKYDHIWLKLHITEMNTINTST